LPGGHGPTRRHPGVGGPARSLLSPVGRPLYSRTSRDDPGNDGETTSTTQKTPRTKGIALQRYQAEYLTEEDARRSRTNRHLRQAWTGLEAACRQTRGLSRSQRGQELKKKIQTFSVPRIPHGLFEPNRNLIRTTLDRISEKYFHMK